MERVSDSTSDEPLTRPLPGRDLAAIAWLLWFAGQGATGAAYPVYLGVRALAGRRHLDYLEEQWSATSLLLVGAALLLAGGWFLACAVRLARGSRGARPAAVLSCLALAAAWWQLGRSGPFSSECCHIDEAYVGAIIGFCTSVAAAIVILLRRPRRYRLAFARRPTPVLFARAAARALDFVVLWFLAAPVFSLHWAVFFFSPHYWDPVMLTVFALAFAAYDAAATMIVGGSFGKIVFGLAVDGAGGGALPWWRAIPRSVLASAAAVTPLVVLIGPILVGGAFLVRDRRMLQDLLTRTRVVPVLETPA